MPTMIVLLAVAAAHAGAPAVTHASADDCAVFAAVGRAQLNWGSAAPIYHLSPIWKRDGGPTYVQDCDWSRLGLARPAIASAASDLSFYFTPPVYDRARKAAVVQLSTSVRSKADQPLFFAALKACKLERKGAGWRLVRCEEVAAS
jgi:hypothetical protein